MFSEKMVTPAIPERVYTLCKIVEKGPISNAELKEKMEPVYLDQATSYFSDYKTAAEELKLINISDNMVLLAVDPSIIETTTKMRQYVNSILEQFQTSQFYQVTQEYFQLDAQVLRGEKRVSEIALMMSQIIGRPVDAPAMLGWRFWMSFLGFGYLHDMFVIPNASVFLLDVLKIANLEKNRRYSFGEFIARVLPFCKIIMGSNLSKKQLNYGVSNGIRTLHDTGIIKMEHILDQEDIWNLSPMKAHAISRTVTNVTICM